MGFGLLLIGYFTASVMSLNISIFKLVGFAIAAKGIKKLSEYNKSFAILLYSCFASILICACCSACEISDFLYANLITAERIIPLSLATVLNYVRYGAECIFTILLCLSVCSISKETGAPKLVYISVRNLVMFCIYIAAQLLCWIPTEAIKSFLGATALPVWVFLFSLLISVLNCLMIFSCYTKICDESDVDMPQKPSRFEFVNRMRAEREERAKERQKRFEKISTDKALNTELYSTEQQKRSAATAKKKKKGK